MDRRGADWSEQEWLNQARRVRRALATVGESLPPCLPDEPAACGQSARSHYASYCAQLKARAQLLIERDIPEPEARITSTVIYESHLVRIRHSIR